MTTAAFVVLCVVCLFIRAMPTIYAPDQPAVGNPDATMLLIAFLLVGLPILSSIAILMTIATALSMLLCGIGWTKRRYAFFSGIILQFASVILALGFGLLVVKKLQKTPTQTVTSRVGTIGGFFTVPEKNVHATNCKSQFDDVVDNFQHR